MNTDNEWTRLLYSLKTAGCHNYAIIWQIATTFDVHHSPINTYLHTQFQRNKTNQYQIKFRDGQNDYLKKAKGHNYTNSWRAATTFCVHHSLIHIYIHTQFQRNLENRYQDKSPDGHSYFLYKMNIWKSKGPQLRHYLADCNNI